MQIHELAALGRTPTTGDSLAIDTGSATVKIDYAALATAILDKIGAGSDGVVDIAHGGTGATTAAAALAALGGVAVTDIVNNLTSTATDKPLSAAMGKALHDAVPYRIECGVAIVPVGSDRIKVDFSTPFSAKPVIVISPENSGNGANVIYTVFDRTVNYFVALFRGSTYPTNDQLVYWIAIGN